MEENKDLEQAESTEQKPAEAEKKSDKKKNIITIAVCAVVIIIAVIIAVVVINNGKDKQQENGGESTTQAVSYETVTDESGEPVTDGEGNTVTQAATTEKGASGSDNSGSGDSSDSGSDGSEYLVDEQTTYEFTTSAKAENRTLHLIVTTPLESGTKDTVIIYVNGKEDNRYDILLDGKEYLFETENKYKGDAEVVVMLETYGTSVTRTIGELYDTESFVLPLNHIEEGYGEID